MHYDFIEIGTSKFSTLIEKADDQTIGLSVEPLSHYLDKLPNPKNVRKLPIGISFNNVEEEIEIYHLPDQYDDGKTYAFWMFGCNSTGGYHPEHVKHNITHLVEKYRVQAIPIGKLFEDYNVTSLTHLKIDTEGGDSDIMIHLANWFKNNPGRCEWPEKIQYETNHTAPSWQIIEESRRVWQDLGYKMKWEGADTWMYRDELPPDPVITRIKSWDPNNLDAWNQDFRDFNHYWHHWHCHYYAGKNISDKGCAHDYLDGYYGKEFADRDRDITLVEIGIGDGYSLVLWREWFRRAKISAIEVNPYGYFHKEPWTIPGATSIFADAYLHQTAAHFQDNSIDYLIDDGNHTVENQLRCIELYFRKIRPGGKIIIEDVQRIEYCTEFEKFIREAALPASTRLIDLRDRKGRYDDIIFEITKL